MFTRTRIPKHTNCVRFSASNHSEAFRLASLFLNGKGRIANAIDVVNARVKYGFTHPIWQYFITTASTEWFGLNKFDEPVIVVLHDKSPFLNAEWLKKNYNSQQGKHKFNVVPRELFHEVCEGKYGPVQVISMTEAISQENENPHDYSYMNRGQLEANKLFRARIGSPQGVKEYLDIHEAGSRKENVRHWDTEEGKAFIKCEPGEYFPQFIGLLYQPQRKVLDLSNSPINLQKEAVAHFITFSGVMRTNGNMIATEIDLSGVSNNCGFIAIMDSSDIHLDKDVAMYSQNDYRNHLSNLFIPVNSAKVDDFYQIGDQKGWYYTYQYRKKIAIGNEQKEWFVTSDPTYSVEGEQKYLVKALKPLARRTLKVLIKDGFYTHEMVKELYKNSNANAFEVINGFKIKGKWYVAIIAYYQAEVYVDRTIPTESEILSDRKLLGRII